MTDFSDLVDGYQRFHTSDWRRERERWAGLAKEQKPRVMIIACSDSRVEPSQIFDTLPGEIFVVRNVAALVPPCESGDGGYHGVSAAIEFAVTQLKVEEIVVLGHGSCGGCKASLAGTFADTAQGDEGRFIGDWVSLLDKARDKVKSEFEDTTSREALRAMEQEGVKTSIENLRTFPFVKKAMDAGELKLQGAVFAIDDGSLVVLEDSGEFAAAKPRM